MSATSRPPSADGVHGASFRQIGDVVRSLDWKEEGDARKLASIPGNGRTAMDMGMDRFYRRLVSLGVHKTGHEALAQRAIAQFARGEAACESPIEKTMLGALIVHDWIGLLSVPPLVHLPKQDTLFPSHADLVIVPQFAFVRFRLDFCIIATIGKQKKFYGVECDGQVFHAGVKRRDDWERDEYLASWGIRVARLSGAEITEDPAKGPSHVSRMIQEDMAEAGLL